MQVRTKTTLPTLLLTVSSLAVASPAFAQEQEAGTEAETTVQDDDFHSDEAIVVTAPFLANLNILAGTSAISGDTLTRELEPQIGETLTKLPGVSATSFTPGASRPVLRGFQGERIRVLTDGIGAIDVSNTSADHGVTVEPLTLERIEVLRGPAVLLFGGQAVGGAVNAIDKRIPRAIPDEAFHLDAAANYASASDLYSAGASLDIPLTDRLVVHFDGSYRESDDLEVGGFTLSPELRAEQLEIAEEEREEGHLEEAAEAEELANLRGFIPNTATRTYTLGAGIAFIDEGGSIGIAASYYDSNYGIPARPGAEHAHGEEEEEHGDEDHDEDHEEEEEEGPVTIGLEQFKLDLRAEANMSGFFDKLRVRAAYADYTHTEFEGDEIGTVFENQGLEGRLELVQTDNNGWRGASGVQYVFRDFVATGAEAFVPPNITNQFGIFTLQEYSSGGWDFEGAARYDRSNVNARTLGIMRSFNSFSAAIGAGYTTATDLKIGVNLSRSERAPAAEELLSNGPHIATQAFEIGNPDFTTEKSIGGEFYVRYDSPDIQLSATAFVNDFEDFIIDIPTGGEEDGLPIFQYIQNDATYYGFEFEGSAKLAEAGGFRFIADTVVDYVHAKLDGLGPVPRIPPLRVLGALEAQSSALTLRGEVEWFADQDRNANFETETEGFTLVNASASWKPFGKGGGLTLIASANNIFDVIGRRAASFTKDFAPLSGRDFRVSAKVSF
ncbi:TonB-dependent receptor [Sphingorhabdus sp. Alg239-R122]|uniref:TonB-dependent receptor n=1 Tax=Sphingorhabdus sp. Alg239-R122 TaxID=2305989 RepID=UPI0013DB3F9A|nr:TonB-dependent receptor [Sphingorhabdus sp. Alg239-R122]